MLSCPDAGDSVSHEHVRVEPNQFRSQRRKTIIAPLGPTVFNRNILSFFVPQVTKAVAERVDVLCIVCGGRQAEEADPVHLRRLLTLDGKRHKREHDREKEPDPPHQHLVRGRLPGSLDHMEGPA